MMGRAHALSGAAAWLAGAPLLASTTGMFDLDIATWATGAVICAGAALAPDLDHPGSSSASNSLKPLTTLLSNIVAVVGFGHRKGTHSLIGVAAFAGLMILATGPLAPWGVLVSAFMLSAFACKALGFNLFKYIPVPASQGVATVATAAGVSWLVWWASGGNYDWFLWAAACGFFIHIVGDFITVSGVPWFWPLGRDLRFTQMRAGGITELAVLTPLFILLICWSLFQGVTSGTVFSHPVAHGERTQQGFTSTPWGGGDSPVISDDSEPKPSKKSKKKTAEAS